MGILDFFSREAGQARRKALEDAISYYIPPELAGPLGLLNELNPVTSMERAGEASGRMMDPNLPGMARIGATGEMLSNVAGVVAPAMVAGRAGVPASAALMEGLLGGSPTTQAAGDSVRVAGRDIAERLSQPGQMPTLYSNPIPGLLPVADQSIDDVLRAKYPEVKLSVTGSPERGYTLNRIEVPKGKRGTGVGSAVMDDLVKLADQQGATLKLSPSADFGGSVPRLKEFYQRFGFVPNKGRSADLSISESMYRLPQSPRDPAAARGQEIMGLLTSGRGADVTDDMLDLGDPVQNARLNEWLYNNYDLPMDAASRAARAEGMGKGLPAFRGTMSDEVSARDRQFVSQNPDVTQSYAGHISFADEIGLPPELAQAEGGNIMPLSVDPSQNSSALRGYELLLPGSDIRSRFARFDPRLSHLRNLNAALVAGAPLGLLTLQDEEQY
jgi:GNAT superfamily N-acetyltransferase